MLTVNSAIADAYRAMGLTVEVVPNVPERAKRPAVPMERAALGWPEDRKVLLMQGAFMDRPRCVGCGPVVAIPAGGTLGFDRGWT